jgi:hypothetical protein
MRTALTIAAALALAVPALAQEATPIPGPLDGPLPRFEGAPVSARPLAGPFLAPNPALAPDGRSGSGLAAGNGAASPLPGPLGRLPERSSAFQQGGCSSLALDAADRVLAVCSGPAGPSLRLLDPVTLGTLSTLTLPPRRSQDQADPAGGTHLIVRADGTLLVPTNNATLLTVAVQGDALVQTGERSLTGLLASGERPVAVAAGFDGRDWVAGDKGTIVTLPRGDGSPAKLELGELVSEDVATDRSGTYVVTQKALYRLRAGADGKPVIVWREAVAPGTTDAKSGRLHPGSGTPPAIVPGGYVAVADGLDPPRLLVLRRGGGAARRLFCAVPLFRKQGHGSVEAQLVVAGRRIVAANAYGFENLTTTEGGKTTTGGIAQVAVGKRECRIVWSSREVAPSAQAAVSRATGLLYTVDKPAGFPDRWNLAALDWRTGKLRFRVLAGEGLGFNSSGGAVLLGPDGAAYAASFGGLSRFKDIDG